MAAPKRKASKSKSRMRHAHNLKIVKPQLCESPESGTLVPRHRVDLASGYYRGKRVFEPEELE